MYTPRHCRADDSEGRTLKTSNKKQFKEHNEKANPFEKGKGRNG